MVHAPDSKWKYDPKQNNLGLDLHYDGPLNAKLRSLPPPTGELLAWNPVEQRAAWRVSYPVVEGGGALTTAGNLVMQGRSDGILAAYRATDGEKLWQYDAGTGIMAPPVTYLVNGVQYVTIMAGWGGPSATQNLPNQGKVKPGYGRILTFAVGGTTTLSVRPFGHTEPPKPAITMNASAATIREGGFLFNGHCAICHGQDAVAGPLPDLRYAPTDVHDEFEDIVLAGARESAGMPSFREILTAEQVRAIQAYVLFRAKQPARPSS